jgi:hypothetical protein
MQVEPPSETSTPDLATHIRQVLVDASWPADAAQTQRLLKQLQRLEPAARAALAAHEPACSFDACLSELR